MRSKSILVVAILAVPVFLVGRGFGALPEYTIIDLGTLYGWSYAQAINDSGEVAGWYYSAGHNRHTSLWDINHSMTDLGTFSGNNSQAIAINKSGHVVGWEYSGQSTDFRNHALLWKEGVITNLGSSEGRAYGINNTGQVVGYSKTSSGDRHAFLWENSGMTNLGTLSGDRQSQAFGINDAGQIVGRSGVTSSRGRAFLWQDGKMIDLGIPAPYSSAIAINTAGQIVGEFGNNTSHPHAFIWNSTNGLIDLGTLGGTMSMAKAINDSNQVVGISYPENPNFGPNAFIWDSNNGMIDLNDLLPPDSGWIKLGYASGINNHGQIVGYGFTDKGDIRAFLLTPIPEPSFAVNIDIKPTSCPNPLNVKSKGVLPVAILGSEDFEITKIDVLSVRLAGISAIRSRFEDVATPPEDANECECSTEGPDGYLDLILKFETQAIVEALGESADGDEWVLELTGNLYDETEIIGEDCVIIRAKSNPKNK